MANPTLFNRCVAEAVGTFALVFAGTGAVVVAAQTGVVTHVGVSLTFGLVIMAMIFAVGDVSGAHFNPAVTVAFWAARRFPGREVGPYILAQCLAAIAASVLLRGMYVDQPLDQLGSLGITVPAGAWWQSAVLELVLTMFLMFVILHVSTGAKERGITAAIAIGGTVALAALFGGPVSGASMNPARSLGPAIVAGRLAELPLYIITPVAGALLAVVCCALTRPGKCCGGQCRPLIPEKA